MKTKFLFFLILTNIVCYSQTTFSSIASGDWDDPSIWNSNTIPTSGSIVILNHDIIVNSTHSLDVIEVNSEASLIISSSADLTFNSLDLKSSSTSFSSLILNGIITGTVNYNRYINLNASSGGNDLISAPLSGQQFNQFAIANPNILAEPDPGIRVLFGDFNTDTATYGLWDETDTRTLNVGEGYRSGATDTNGYNFTGNVNSNNINQTISIGVATKWNLIGNPYPSYLDSQSFLVDNINILDPNSSAIYGYNDSSDESTAGNRNRYTIINFLQNNSKNLSPGQGFFLASNSSGGSAQFTPAMRSIEGSDDFIQGRTNNSINNLGLILTKGSDNFITNLYFTSDATQGLDPGYDATLFGESAPAFSIYSDLVQNNTGLAFTIQALGETDYENITIPLGINALQGEQIAVSIENTTLPSTVEVYLDDNVANSSTLLNTTDYIITPSTDLNGTGRFYLRLTDNTLSTTFSDIDDFEIFVNNNKKTITILGNINNKSRLNIFDLQGRIVLNKSLISSPNNNQNIDANSLQKGVYIVKLTDGNQTRTEKIILN